MDDPSRSSLGDLFRSAIGDVRKSIVVPQIRIGNDAIQTFISGPIDTGNALAFFVETETDDTIGAGIMLVSYDFSEVLETSLSEVGVAGLELTQFSITSGAILFALHDAIEEASYVVDLSIGKIIGLLTSPEIMAVNRTGGNYSVCYHDSTSGHLGPSIGLFSTAGVYSERQKYFSVVEDDISFIAPPLFSDNDYFIPISFGSLTGMMVASGSDPSSISAVTFGAPAPGVLGATESGVLAAVTILGGTSSIAIGSIRRGADAQILFGIDKDLNVLWAKSTKKQESTVTIVINDTASTYRISITGHGSSQSEEVPGNAAGAAATAADLQAQCASSVKAQFTRRTFTVSGNTVTARASNAGILYTWASSVIGGTGTRTITDSKFPLLVSPRARFMRLPPTLAATDTVAIPAGAYGVLVIDAATGEVLGAAITESSLPSVPLFGGTGSIGAAYINDVTYISARSGFPESFGGSGDVDWQVFQFDAIPSNRVIQLEDTDLTATPLTIQAEDFASSNLTLSDITTVGDVDSFDTQATEYIH